ALYNWYAVQSGKLCPLGWRVPTIEDVQELVSYAGGAGIAGKVLKEPGTVYWKSPNSDSTDVYGFSARGGGKRSEKGIDDFQKVEGTWWISEEYSIANASYFNILFNYSNLFVAYYNKKTGMSVRCVKD
ncbi:MAG: fibrobacter succinogenes major paralogous domain-containing protein, partial [Bacteroidales bacterium]|nr:fibrobacter succinogenes major paralogous domain-containing protein [Bacteroidales bacterium]